MHKRGKIEVREMYPYMIGSPEVGNYKAAFDLSLRTFSAREPADMAETGGCEYDPQLETFSLRDWV